MYLELKDEKIPGTRLTKSDMDDVTGMEFLSKIFYITDGIMLSQIKDISGIDGSTLQNWTKRGWVANSKNKKYGIDQLARILIINMLRESMQLEKIDFLLRYINGKPDDKTDDIIPESQLYDYICRIADSLPEKIRGDGESLRSAVASSIDDFKEKTRGDKKRLARALEIIMTAYYTSMLKNYSGILFNNLKEG